MPLSNLFFLDMYSFDVDVETAEETYDVVSNTYSEIFRALHLPVFKGASFYHTGLGPTSGSNVVCFRLAFYMFCLQARASTIRLKRLSLL